MKKTFLFCSFFLATLAFSEAAFAQLKIGNNITKVDPNASLEVEGVTNGRRFRIDKSTGQVTIRDGSQGNGRVLTSDVQGRASWQLINSNSLSPSARGVCDGAYTSELKDDSVQIIPYPNFRQFSGGFWILDEKGFIVGQPGNYNVRTRLEMVNSSGCTGTSLMSLSVDLVRNGVVIENSGTRDRLSPVYAENFVYNVSILAGISSYDRIGFSIKADIKNPQPGCTTKVTSGYISLTYQN
ncbi:hypothetical protein [Dyadobacter sediminis]|uniref:DUF4402 domain-containing protein n=1 Tax=Dyadobacter sediminis TaxID=1493691 RepID=A0A5R9K6P4_9BACT|nr:hypothetical protein [Dyadobacter sediminis]TLU89460.1 hypothetical protein FEM55_22230 [Dyadobacter sediminis]GGC05191.1 hypothetical protein GCM10011325_35120 [Dyadobacter sediminis]